MPLSSRSRRWLLPVLLSQAFGLNLNAADEWRIKPLPPCEIVGPNSSVAPEKLQKIADGVFKDNPSLADLGQVELVFTFPRPVALKRLAVIRVGWDDWAKCEQVALAVNGQSARIIDLKGESLAPNTKSVWPRDLDIIALDADAAVTKLELKVTRVSGRNAHGSLEVVAVEPAPPGVAFSPLGGVPRNCSGMTLRLQTSPECRRVDILARARIFRSEATWRASKSLTGTGECQLQFAWNELLCSEEPETVLNPTHLFALELIGPTPEAVKLRSWEFSYDGRTDYLPAWESLPPLDLLPTADGWRPGIPTSGFGRYGWLTSDGLLVGSVSPRKFVYEAMDRQGRAESASFAFGLGPTERLSWLRRTVDWTGADNLALYRADEEAKALFDNKAFGEYDKTRLPERFIYSTLAPGFLIQSQDKWLTINLGPCPQAPQLLFAAPAALRWHDLAQPLNGEELTEGWVVICPPEHPQLPLLVALQKRPEAILVQNDLLCLKFKTPLGYVGFGTPAGYRGWAGQVGQTNAETESLAEHSRLLAKLLRAYPRTCHQQFREEAGGVRIRETFTHLEWENEWDEPATRVSPLNPLLAFARSQHYPVKYEAAQLTDSGIATKYGPYLFTPAESLEYLLPTPPTDPTIYLKPQHGMPELTARISAGLNDFAVETDDWLKRDCLGAWWLLAPTGVSVPLLTEKDRAEVLVKWRELLVVSAKPNLWHLRTEPYSQSRYLVSFGWKEKNTDTLGDVNSGNCAFLHGLYTYAQASGDWDFVRENWPVIEGAFRYVLVQHDWVQMQTCAREHSGSSAIDMDVIGFLGALSFQKIAEKLGQDDQAALARLCVARLALSTGMRWLGRSWIQPDLPREQWPTPTLGFGESRGFDVPWFNPQQYPDFANSEIALSLSWVGQYPELYNLHLWALGKDFWQWFEYDYVENKLKEWRKDHPGNRNNHPANVAAHLYMRGLLGCPLAELTKELTENSPGLTPSGIVLRENADLYALYLGRDFPVNIKDCGLAGIKSAVFDETQKRAEITFSAAVPTIVKLFVARNPQAAAINGRPLDIADKITGSVVEVKLDKGESKIELRF